MDKQRLNRYFFWKLFDDNKEALEPRKKTRKVKLKKRSSKTKRKTRQSEVVFDSAHTTDFESRESEEGRQYYDKKLNYTLARSHSIYNRT